MKLREIGTNDYQLGNGYYLAGTEKAAIFVPHETIEPGPETTVEQPIVRGILEFAGIGELGTIEGDSEHDWVFVEGSFAMDGRTHVIFQRDQSRLVTEEERANGLPGPSSDFTPIDLGPVAKFSAVPENAVLVETQAT